jgi:hypothetical protein
MSVINLFSSFQILLLLRQLPTSESHETGENDLAKCLHIQNQELEKMEVLQKELAVKTEELDNLKHQLTSKGQKMNQVCL